MPVSYTRQSPYYNTPQNSYYLGFWQAPAVAPSSTNAVITVAQRYRQRPDLLAFDLYGSSQLWWVFAMANPDQIRDPIFDLQPDMQIQVPSAESLQGYI
jgi:hypothetical protein